jgi:large subunit ribosomal protein L22
MDVIAKNLYKRGSAKKARLVIALIRGKQVLEALQILNFVNKSSAKIIKDTLKSAIANAENNFGLDVDSLVVKRATVDEGPAGKRFRARARGRASRILKRTSHVVITLGAV